MEAFFESKWAAVAFVVVVTVAIYLFRRFEKDKKRVDVTTKVNDKIVAFVFCALLASAISANAQQLASKTYICKKSDMSSCELVEKSQKRVIDKKFIFATSFSIGAAALDVHSSRYCMTRNPRCYEAVGIFSGSRPSAAQLVAINVPMQIGVNGLGYLLKKHHKRYWWAPQVAFGLLRVGIATRNYRLTRR